jgi:hypothetical protein
MVSQNTIACMLIATGLLLLAVVNQLGWLLFVIPLAYLAARSLAGTERPGKHRGVGI